MKVKERRWMDMDDLRKLCISHGWFTHGNNEEYEKFLNKTNACNITTARILEMARTIVQYSDPETYEILELEGIMYCLGEICHTSFFVEE